mmetsp:Transcript_8926/g.20113  ORF Transcript_8926/g.20113 Transcript_8926/m.20113 type:complete len:345 (+) Transcript_8926:222-1256(+)
MDQLLPHRRRRARPKHVERGALRAAGSRAAGRVARHLLGAPPLRRKEDFVLLQDVVAAVLDDPKVRQYVGLGDGGLDGLALLGLRQLHRRGVALDVHESRPDALLELPRDLVRLRGPRVELADLQLDLREPLLEVGQNGALLVGVLALLVGHAVLLLRQLLNLLLQLLDFVRLLIHVVEQGKVLVLVFYESAYEFLDVGDAGGGLDLEEGLLEVLHAFHRNRHVNLLLGDPPRALVDALLEPVLVLLAPRLLLAHGHLVLGLELLLQHLLQHAHLLLEVVLLLAVHLLVGGDLHLVVVAGLIRQIGQLDYARHLPLLLVELLIELLIDGIEDYALSPKVVDFIP